MSPRIGLLGSKGTTLDLLTGFRAATGHDVTHLITLSQDTKAAGKVAFFQGDALRAAARDLTVHEARSYTLTHADDQAFFDAADLDVLFVLGWERLLPDAVLRSVRHGVFGMHGSSHGLPRGRGRSPMNWSIIQGHDRFITSLFRYSPGIDDGDVIDSRVFTVGPRDDVGVLHMKNRVCMMLLIRRHLDRILAGQAQLTPQPDEPPSFYPKRTPEDGGIDWSRSSQEIDRLVRAVAPPYPGAFCELGGERLTVEAAQPFEMALFESDIAPGTILDVSPSMNMMVVKTGDGSLLVTRMSGAAVTPAHRGHVLTGQGTAWTRELLAERYGPEQPEPMWELRPTA